MRKGQMLSLADFVSFFVFTIAVLAFMVLFRTCSATGLSQQIAGDEDLALKAQASQQLLNYLRTPVIQDIDELNERYAETGGVEGAEATKSLEANPEIIRDKNYAEFIAQVYTIDDSGKQIGVFRFVTDAMFYRSQKGEAMLLIEFPDGKSVDANLWGIGSPPQPEAIASAQVPLYDTKTAEVKLYVGAER